MPALVIAEAGVNHNGSLQRALQMVDAAAEARADVVKFQSFVSGRLVRAGTEKAEYQKETTGADEGQLEMLRALELSPEDHRLLANRCVEQGIEFLSTPFDADSLQMLVQEKLICRLKLGSGDLTNGPLLAQAAKTGLPVVLSTGMATVDEIDVSVGLLAYFWDTDSHESSSPSPAAFLQALESMEGRKMLAERLTLLQCTTSYPAPLESIHLKAMTTLGSRYGVRVGFSDHTEGIHIALAAAALGAEVIEKHFTLDRNLPGPDHRASVEPEELAALVRGVRDVEEALGQADKQPGRQELNNRRAARRSLVAAQPIAAGEHFTASNLTSKRPEGGVSPMRFWELEGQPSPRAFSVDEEVEL